MSYTHTPEDVLSYWLDLAGHKIPFQPNVVDPNIESEYGPILQACSKHTSISEFGGETPAAWCADIGGANREFLLAPSII